MNFIIYLNNPQKKKKKKKESAIDCFSNAPFNAN